MQSAAKMSGVTDGDTAGGGKAAMLTDADIRRVSGIDDLRIVRYPELKSFRTWDDFLSNKGRAAAVLFLTENDTTGHWLAAFDGPGQSAVVFDPLGLGVDAERKLLSPQKNAALGQAEPEFARLLVTAEQAGKRPTVNHTDFQEFKASVNTCGRWTALRLAKRNLTPAEFSSFVRSAMKEEGCTNADDWVTRATSGGSDEGATPSDAPAAAEPAAEADNEGNAAADLVGAGLRGSGKASRSNCPFFRPADALAGNSRRTPQQRTDEQNRLLAAQRALVARLATKLADAQAELSTADTDLANGRIEFADHDKIAAKVAKAADRHAYADLVLEGMESAMLERQYIATDPLPGGRQNTGSGFSGAGMRSGGTTVSGGSIDAWGAHLADFFGQSSGTLSGGGKLDMLRARKLEDSDPRGSGLDAAPDFIGAGAAPSKSSFHDKEDATGTARTLGLISSSQTLPRVTPQMVSVNELHTTAHNYKYRPRDKRTQAIMSIQTPPVWLFKTDAGYTVLDGVHRISAAKRRGDEGIRAYVYSAKRRHESSGGMEGSGPMPPETRMDAPAAAIPPTGAPPDRELDGRGLCGGGTTLCGGSVDAWGSQLADFFGRSNGTLAGGGKPLMVKRRLPDGSRFIHGPSVSGGERALSMVRTRQLGGPSALSSEFKEWHRAFERAMQEAAQGRADRDDAYRRVREKRLNPFPAPGMLLAPEQRAHLLAMAEYNGAMRNFFDLQAVGKHRGFMRILEERGFRDVPLNKDELLEARAAPPPPLQDHGLFVDPDFVAPDSDDSDDDGADAGATGASAEVGASHAGQKRRRAKDDLEGSGPMPPERELQPLATASYKKTPPHRVGSYSLIYETPTLKFYKSDATNTIIAAIRGTADVRDVSAWLPVATNKLDQTERWKEDNQTFQQVQRQYPVSSYDYYAVGHSLGGAIADLALQHGYVKEALSFNAAVQRKDLGNTDAKHKRIYSHSDLLGKLGSWFGLKGNTETRTVDANTALAGHALSNFDSPAPDALQPEQAQQQSPPAEQSASAPVNPIPFQRTRGTGRLMQGTGK